MKKLLHFTLLAALPFLANAQLQNTDFEIWNNPINEQQGMSNTPTAWIRTNGYPGNESLLGQLYWPPIADAQSGAYAMRLSVWYSYDKDMAYQVAPIASRPAALNGYYKYTENEALEMASGNIVTDFASASVILTKWNAAQAQDVIIGSGQISLGAAEDYTYFSCPVTYISDEVPDKIKVTLDCSLMKKTDEGTTHFSAFEGGVSSIFTVDNLMLSETMGNESFAAKAKVYPNPATNTINIAGFEGTAALFDPTGKKVLEQHYTGNGIDISRLQQGMYLLRLDDGKETLTTRVIKQ